jgi:hypothetical protein
VSSIPDLPEMKSKGGIRHSGSIEMVSRNIFEPIKIRKVILNTKNTSTPSFVENTLDSSS